MITIRTGSLTRDLAFLQLAEDDRLTELGYHHANIRVRSIRDTDPVDESADALILNWSDRALDRDDMLRQMVCLAVVGPSARASRNLCREVLGNAGKSLLSIADTRPPIIVVTAARPHLQQSVGGHLVTIGYDVFSAARCREW
jgi:hypothetical protein